MPHDLSGDPHWHEPTGETYAGTSTWKRHASPYDNFMLEQEIPIIRDIAIPCLQEVGLRNWERMGGKGAFIQLLGTEGLSGSYLIEVSGARALKVERHLYEEIFLVLEGCGTTEVWTDEQAKPDIFEWEKGFYCNLPFKPFGINASTVFRKLY